RGAGVLRLRRRAGRACHRARLPFPRGPGAALHGPGRPLPAVTPRGDLPARGRPAAVDRQVVARLLEEVSMRRDFRLPDLGEGLTEGEVIKWLVAEGDTVILNQPVVEVETAKAAVELPSPYAGTVVGLHAGEGEVVEV